MRILRSRALYAKMMSGVENNSLFWTLFTILFSAVVLPRQFFAMVRKTYRDSKPAYCTFCMRIVAPNQPPAGAGMTAGFYDCRGDSHWREFVPAGVDFACDDCMWKQAKYQVRYRGTK